ncbi:hypothetical protein DL107_08260 [Salmonella enterica subsp. enterica serovar Java]|nr:hypothetical protein [Salmonella enterica subsp. enterica serovar Java]
MYEAGAQACVRREWHKGKCRIRGLNANIRQRKTL